MINKKEITLNNIIIYDLAKLGRFLMGREDGGNGYFVIKRDVFDILKDGEIVKFTMKKGTIMNPSYADETVGRFIKEFPGIVFVDKDLGYAVEKVFETLEITNGIKVEYI
ncbi:MAG: hypothetical protein Q9M94_07470 [Candidatus Gracilibacteria bacterium]|nr:hypothetical protein [Candidatus Gracilibacteria bacterium]